MTLASGSTFACSCIESLPLPSYQQRVESAYSEYDAVFLGKVTKVQSYIDTSDTSRGRFKKGTPFEIATFKVIDEFKGVSSDTFETRAITVGGMCGYNVLLHKKYLIYAIRSEGKYYLSFCSRTKPKKEAHRDLAILRGIRRR